MARYKPCDVHQDKFIPVSFRDQILPGSFEYSLNEIVDQHIDLSPFAARYTNDETGRLAYDPSVLLKIVLYASELNLIGQDTFAIDGCKLPSNASKQWSVSLKELRHKQKKLDAAARKIVARHQAQDAQEKLSPVVAQEEKKRATYERQIDNI